MADNRRITIELSVEEMGRVSIMLDHATNYKIGQAERQTFFDTPEDRAIQRKFDELYQGVHKAIRNGVRSLDIPDVLTH